MYVRYIIYIYIYICRDIDIDIESSLHVVSLIFPHGFPTFFMVPSHHGFRQEEVQGGEIRWALDLTQHLATTSGLPSALRVESMGGKGG